MGEYKSSTLVKTPQIKFTREGFADVADTFFVGVKTAQRKIDDTSIVFDITLESAHEKLFIGMKDGVGTAAKWVDSEVKEGSRVSLFGGYNEKGKANQIADKLAQVPDGTKIKMTYNGKVQNPKTKRYYNDFTLVDA